MADGDDSTGWQFDTTTGRISPNNIDWKNHRSERLESLRFTQNGLTSTIQKPLSPHAGETGLFSSLLP